MTDSEKLIIALLAIPGAIAFAVGYSALFALPVQYLVNHLAAPFVHLTFRQAWALSLLSHLLFKSSK